MSKRSSRTPRPCSARAAGHTRAAGRSKRPLPAREDFPDDVHRGAIPWDAETLARILSAESALGRDFPLLDAEPFHPELVHLTGRQDGCLDIQVSDGLTAVIVMRINQLHRAEPLPVRSAHIHRYGKIHRFLGEQRTRLVHEGLVRVATPGPEADPCVSMALLAALATQPSVPTPDHPEGTFDPEPIIAFAQARRSQREQTP